ncbi:MAG: hypothetical protein WDN28_05765 [Chthoniobacter sp.]
MTAATWMVPRSLFTTRVARAFAFHVLSNDEEGLAGLGGLLQHGEEILEAGDLLLVDENVRAVEHASSDSALVTK